MSLLQHGNLHPPCAFEQDRCCVLPRLQTILAMCSLKTVHANAP